MIISIVNNKGGVGKTTASINLSCALSLMKRNRVLIIDMDPQAHSTCGMGIAPDVGRSSIGDIMLSLAENRYVFFYQKNIKDVIIPTLRNGVDIIPSNIKLSNALEPLYKSLRFFKFTRYDLLKQSIEPIKKSYEYIIIDCPTGVGMLTLSAIKASDFILIPCEISSGSVMGVKDLVSKVMEINGKSFDNYRILYSMIDYRCSGSVKSATEQLYTFKDKVLKTNIKKSELFNQSQFEMRDIFDFAPDSDAAKNYLTLAEELTKVWKRR